MKVLLVAGKLTSSNPSVYTLSLARGLLGRGHQVEVASHGGGFVDRLTELGVENYPVYHNFYSWRRLLQLLGDSKPDIIHSTGGSRALETGLRISRRIGVPMVHTLHSWLPEDQIEQYTSELAGVLVVNQSLREHLVNERQIPKSRIRVVAYGVEPHPDPWRRPVDEGERMFVVGTMGRLAKGRRQDEFLEAALKVREVRDDVHFLVVGEGPEERQLRSLTKSLGLQDCVTFTDPGAKDDIFAVLDLLVVVSDWGGAALSLLQGMAEGCPVLVTGGGEVFSLLQEEDTCELVSDPTPERLADAIVKLLENPARRAEIARKAYDRVSQSFPLEAHLIAIEECYAEFGG